MGGGFGGKESQATQWAVLAALAARMTGRPCKIRLDRDDDMMMTGKRHDFAIDYAVGFDDEGRIRALDSISTRAAATRPICRIGVVDRTMFHSDNAYFLPDVHGSTRAAARPTPSPTPPSAASAGRRA